MFLFPPKSLVLGPLSFCIIKSTGLIHQQSFQGYDCCNTGIAKKTVMWGENVFKQTGDI